MNKHLLGGAFALTLAAGCCSLCNCTKDAASAYPETVEEGFEQMLGYWGLPNTTWEGATSAFQNAADPKTGVMMTLMYRPELKGKIPEGKRHNLYTKKEYRNFILRFEFALNEGGDAGIAIRMPAGKDGDAAYEGMCEVQILDDAAPQYANCKPYQYCGSVFGIAAARRDNGEDKQICGKIRNFAGNGSYLRTTGQWNFEEIKVVGEQIEVWLNGILVSKADLSKCRGDGDTLDSAQHPGLHTPKGRIGFLCDKDPVKFRHIRIKALPDSLTTIDQLDDCKCGKMQAPAGFETYFNGRPDQLRTMWKGVTTKEKFDRPEVRQAATPAKRAEMQKIADKERDEHWFVRGNTLYFDGFKGGYSLATVRDYADFELWADWRLLSVTGDSGLYLRGLPQVQIWDPLNMWHIGSGGLFNNPTAQRDATTIADRQVGDWNRFHIKMIGDKVWVWLNGVKVVDGVPLQDYRDAKRPIPACEQIELQCHGDPLEWRNVFIKAL